MRPWKACTPSGQNDYIPPGLLARAAFRRAVGDWEGAAREVDEANEIRQRAPMRLFLCDVALERARLALARRKPSRRSTASSSRAPLRRLCQTRPRTRGSWRKRAKSSTGRASSSPNAAITAATRNSPSLTPSPPAAAASPISRRASER